MKTFVAALMVSVGLATALDPARHGAKTVSLYSAPFNSSYILEGEKGGMTAAFENLAILAFRQENQMVGYLVPKGIKSIFDPANVDLLPLKKFLYSDAPKVALTLSAAELLEIPEMSLAMPKLHLPAYNLDITFHVDQGSTQYPYILFLHKEHVHPGNHYTLDHLTLLGDFSFSDDLVKIDNDYVPDFMKPQDKRVSETHPY